MQKLGLAIGPALALATPANALSLPEGGTLKFDVIRKGKDIGEHSNSFSGSEQAFSAKVTTDIVVKPPPIRTTDNSFKHDSTKQWKGGKFQTLNSTTNDDGKGAKLSTATNGALPASLWNDDIVQSGKLMNIIDGKIMSIRAADLGIEFADTKRGHRHTGCSYWRRRPKHAPCSS